LSISTKSSGRAGALVSLESLMVWFKTTALTIIELKNIATRAKRLNWLLSLKLIQNTPL